MNVVGVRFWAPNLHTPSYRRVLGDIDTISSGGLDVLTNWSISAGLGRPSHRGQPHLGVPRMAHTPGAPLIA